MTTIDDDHRWFPTRLPPTRGSADHRRQLKVARLHAFPISIPPPPPPPPCITKPRFRFVSVGRVCTDCSDRSHPSHIGFVAGNRIHVHLCCYYRAIGVFVYWLTKSTDIESDNRHYFCPVPDPFSNPTPPSPSPLCRAFPLSRSRPRNAAHGTARSAKYRGGARETRAWTQSSPVCVHWYTTQPNPDVTFRYSGVHGVQGRPGSFDARHRKRAYTAIVHRARQQRALAASYRGFAPVQTVKMPVHTYMYRWCAVWSSWRLSIGQIFQPNQRDEVRSAGIRVE